MTEPLVDAEDFPRGDIDIYEVRTARHNIICECWGGGARALRGMTRQPRVCWKPACAAAINTLLATTAVEVSQATYRSAWLSQFLTKGKPGWR